MGCLKENFVKWGVSYVLDIARTFIYLGWKNFYILGWNIRKKILSFRIILEYQSLPETSLRSFIKTSIVVSEIQTANQPTILSLLYYSKGTKQ